MNGGRRNDEGSAPKGLVPRSEARGTLPREPQAVPTPPLHARRQRRHFRRKLAQELDGVRLRQVSEFGEGAGPWLRAGSFSSPDCRAHGVFA